MTLTTERLRHVLSYDQDTGVFTNRIRRGVCEVGKVVGTVNKDGHLRIRLDFKRYFAHRLAWFYVTGEWPENQIDHIDGDPGNNRFANLRDAHRSINMQNRRKAQKNSATGVLGVQFAGKYGYRAAIKQDGKPTYIGTYRTLEEARQAYLERKRTIHPGCTI